MDIIFVSLQRINTGRDSTSTSLAKELSKNHRVIYVNPPIDRKAFYQKNNDKFISERITAIQKKEHNLSEANENLWILNPSCKIESINWIPSTKIFSLFNKFNNEKFAREIQSAIDALKFKDYIIINDKDIFRSFYLKDILNPKKYIYLDRDYTIGMAYWKRHGAVLEPKLMRKSSAVVCNSEEFTKRAKRHNPHSYYIGNGFDTAQYNGLKKYTVPPDLKHIPGPRIGYIGAIITMRLDLNLITAMAKAKPEWSFVFVGWEDDAFRQSKLHGLTNVHFLGKKHTNEVPAYIAHFDVCINPQALNDITNGNFPLKVVEYLALGKPVVATATSTMKNIFSQHAYLSNGSASDFTNKIETALEEESPQLQEDRKSFVQKFSWEQVAANLLDCLKQLD